MRAHDILRGVDLLAERGDVDPSSIHAMARGVKGIWLLLAAAADTRLAKIWLDRTPYSLRLALKNSMNTGLFDAVIPGFVLIGTWMILRRPWALGQSCGPIPPPGCAGLCH